MYTFMDVDLHVYSLEIQSISRDMDLYNVCKTVSNKNTLNLVRKEICL